MPNPHRYLLEVGTEELPVPFLLSAPAELCEKVKTLLNQYALPFHAVSAEVTPRRITLDITGLPEQQASQTETVKGPPVRIALDETGNPSKAGLGFAKKMGIAFETLQQECIEGETYLVLHQNKVGQSVRDILAKHLPETLLGLSGSHFMAWGTGSIRFSRPIRWLLSLWDAQSLPICIGAVESAQYTYGHRLLANTKIAVHNPDHYLDELRETGRVILQAGQRKALIVEQLNQTAKSMKATVIQNDDLLDTVTMLVEYPSVMVGKFEERFLTLPSEVIQTVMTAHQKYFALQDQSGKLLPCFLIVSNGDAACEKTICHGNEKVIKARLQDASFFFEEDRKKSLASYVQQLSGITFQKKLGTMADKTARLEQLTHFVAEHLAYTPQTLQHAVRAAHLAKADLVTGMVFELTELQGIMGMHYAKHSGEPNEVAIAIQEHYLPRFMGDGLAQSQAGIAVSLADKIDTVVTVFSQQSARLPSGSKDPMGLRRMVTGIIQTILDSAVPDSTLPNQPLRVNLPLLFSVACQNLMKSQVGQASQQFRTETETLQLISDFILQRLRGLLLEQHFRYDVIEAALDASQPALEDLGHLLDRCKALKHLTGMPEEFSLLYEPANRVARILGDQYKPEVTLNTVEVSRFCTSQEKALFAQLESILQNPAKLDSETACINWLEQLGTLAKPVELFFEGVMVNDPDAQVRNNRYNLLSLLHQLYLQMACFSRLSQVVSP
jgi:glycyl-tRNA synthetase beta chain